MDMSPHLQFADLGYMVGLIHHARLYIVYCIVEFFTFKCTGGKYQEVQYIVADSASRDLLRRRDLQFS